jgi:dTDP-4-amino-4,6-dideoxygalactose transaminase
MISDFLKPSLYISFSPPAIGEEEEREVLDSLRSGWITTGPKVKEFENKIAEFVQAKEAVATFSCTDAMHLALNTLGIQEGDEVITTPYTFASTAHVICYQRAKPVFIDVEADSFNIDPKKIEEKITPKTKAILPVHFAGHACDMDPIMDIAKKHSLRIVEDAAHAIGTSYKGRIIGSFGDITCYSFYATKNLTTAEGGMAVTNNPEWSKRMRMMTMYGISDAREIWEKRYRQAGSIHYDIAELGFKCNMTDINAALGLKQLEKLEGFNEQREVYCQIYDREFKDHSGLRTPHIKDYTKSSRHLYPLLLNLEYLSIERDEFINALKEINIGASVLFMPLHLHSYYAKLLNHKWGDFPVAENLFERVICLPLSPALLETDIKKVAEGVLYLLERFKR